jgi:hypothetical protein
MAKNVRIGAAPKVLPRLAGVAKHTTNTEPPPSVKTLKIILFRSTTVNYVAATSDFRGAEFR